MIIPSIDIMKGRAVQLRKGREFVLDGGDPQARLEEFAVAGEVAVVDLDAAMGRGSNEALIRDMVRRAPCRVGGGIRSIEAALRWLDAGAERIVVGTAASPDFCSRLPRDRVVAAVDAEAGRVVVDGWRSCTGRDVLELIDELQPYVGGFLLTQVEHEGGLAGFDRRLVERAIEAASPARVTAAGGITAPQEIADLDRLSADAQVGMALYAERLSLGAAVAAPLANAGAEALWPTVVCDEDGSTLGLVWSTHESLEAAVTRRRGIYWSRSRGDIWVKGETSGATQELLRVDLDCDRDAVRFTVRQRGSGFCHTGARGCWRSPFSIAALARTISQRRDQAPEGSGTAQLFARPELLAAKLREEAEELAEATGAHDVAHETADLLYLTLVAAVRAGVSLESIQRELERRHLRVRRRPMVAKPEMPGS